MLSRVRVVSVIVGMVTLLTPGSSALAGDVQPVRALDWQACAAPELQGWECATLTVPRDYADASRGTFDLAVVRLAATGTARERVGSLFFNPGGPGISGIVDAPILATALPTSLRQRFDFVSWDPRGVGLSSGLEGCGGASAALPATGPVDWTTVLTQLRASQSSANRDCERRHPDVVPYIGTKNTVRDLDALRAAVGDETLSFWAPSYGSRIGYVYTQMFPGRVRAILATGAVNPASSIADLALGIGGASDTALEFFFTKYPHLQGAFDRVRAALEQQPLTLPSGYQFTRWDLAIRMFLVSAYESDWPRLATLLDNLKTAIDGSGAERDTALTAVDAGLHYGGFATQGPSEVFINCLDYPDRPAPREQLRLAADIRADGPIVGPILASFAMQCAGMTIDPDPVPTVTAPDPKVTMLISTASHDGRTPYRWTKAMAKVFPNSRLVDVPGGNHTTFVTLGSECVDKAGVTFFSTGRLPKRDIACPR